MGRWSGGAREGISRDGRKVSKPGKGGKSLLDGFRHYDNLDGMEAFDHAMDENDPNYDPDEVYEVPATLKAAVASKQRKQRSAQQGDAGDWQLVETAEGRYWYNTKTFETSMEKPSGVPSLPQSPRFRLDEEMDQATIHAARAKLMSGGRKAGGKRVKAKYTARRGVNAAAPKASNTNNPGAPAPEAQEAAVATIQTAYPQMKQPAQKVSK